jgi:dihydrofolate reductase/GNAT superfamily N-acetyltransferase
VEEAVMINRPKISIYIAVSIDGYIARRDGSLDWLDRVGGFGDEDYGFQGLLESVDVVILGRKTYEVAASVSDWPYTGKRIIVLSHSLQSVREEAELFRGDVNALISQLHSEGIQHIWVDGGVTISQFLDLQIIDFMTLSVIPMILGSGIPLFGAIAREIPCRLISSQSYPSGLAQLHYEVVKKFTAERDLIHFKVIDYGSDFYKKSVALREEVLLRPLGLQLEGLELEKQHVHIAGFLGEELCATAALVLEGDACKMQRVAIKTHFQNKGVGSGLVAFCEEYARSHGCARIYCGAKGAVVPFYLGNQYILEGQPFDHAGIPHQIMGKCLS